MRNRLVREHRITEASSLPELRGYLHVFMWTELGLRAALLTNRTLRKIAEHLGVDDQLGTDKKIQGIVVQDLRNGTVPAIIPFSSKRRGMVMGPPLVRIPGEHRDVIRFFLRLRFARADPDDIDDSKMGDLRFLDETVVELAKRVLTDDFMERYDRMCVVAGENLCGLPDLYRVLHGKKGE